MITYFDILKVVKPTEILTFETKLAIMTQISKIVGLSLTFMAPSLPKLSSAKEE